MPAYCLVPGCRPSSRRVSYHSLPRNQELAKHWLELCGRTDLIGSKSATNAKICSAHFRKSDFKNHYQYTLMTSGSSAARPRLKNDAVPTFVTLGWRKIRTAPVSIRPACINNPEQDELRQKYVSDALQEYESGRLLGGSSGVQQIRHRLKMRRARRPLVDVVQVDRRGDQVLVGGTFSDLALSPEADGRRAGAAAPVWVFASRGLTEQLAAESGAEGEDADAQAVRLIQGDVGEADGAWGSASQAAEGLHTASLANGMGPRTSPPRASDPCRPAESGQARGSDRLPPGMPERFRDILGRQRTIRSLQLTLRRQTEQLQALQARHEVDLEEQGFAADVAPLFPPADAGPAAAGADDAAGGDMLLSPTTLDEAHTQLHRLRTEVLELRVRVLENAVVANERALAANGQQAELLRVFTPRQVDVLLGRRPRQATHWEPEDLRRAVALRRHLTRRQYEHVRDVLLLHLPVTDEVEVGGEDQDRDEEQPGAKTARTRPMRVAVTPSDRMQNELDAHASLWDDHFP
ncbi:uncharacterized protein LOC119093377 [Pollicipes pollicipes]|uniref:uncharacterized protein LOC119093377 n=1 Tax=Pollicipes pollicipes TaxID=41117 RepID=UPI001885273F|nr:uncharacterized protein LOC119093377 [Pollicipes pollicipes]